MASSLLLSWMTIASPFLSVLEMPLCLRGGNQCLVNRLELDD